MSLRENWPAAIHYAAYCVDKLADYLRSQKECNAERDPWVYEQGIGCERAAKMLREIAVIFEREQDSSEKGLAHTQPAEGGPLPLNPDAAGDPCPGDAPPRAGTLKTMTPCQEQTPT